MLRLVVLVSGGGTNLQAIIDAIDAGDITNTELVKVISNKEGVKALERAEKAGVAHEVVSKKNFESVEEFNKALLASIDEAKPDLIVLAGFLVVLPSELVSKYTNKIITNIMLNT